MKESEVQAWVQSTLRKEFGESIYLFKVPQGQYTSRRGLPDLMACVNGKFMAIEVKTEIGSLTELQKFEIEKIRLSGGLSFVIYGKDEINMKRIIKILRG
jgi:VRR-NUC domain